jgi:hypothetical protein
MNNGWVAEIYLASPGGNLLTGMFLGQLARTFWLKTVAVGNGFFEYVPDFVALTIAPPGSDEAVTRTSGFLIARNAHDVARLAAVAPFVDKEKNLSGHDIIHLLAIVLVRTCVIARRAFSEHETGIGPMNLLRSQD